MSQITFFEKRISHFKSLEDKAAKTVKKWVYLRLVTFLVATLASILLFNAGSSGLGILCIIVGIGLLLFLVKKHQKAKKEEELFSILQNINADEIKRLNLELKEFETGEEFINRLHPFATDVDLFGRHSLFQLLNRSATEHGKAKLAAFIQRHEPEEEIKNRQEFFKNLNLEWHQLFEARGKQNSCKIEEVNNFKEWLNDSFEDKKSHVIKLASILCPIITLAACGLYFTSYINGYILTALFIPSSLIYRQYAGLIKRHKAQSEQQVKVLSQLFELIVMAENIESTSAKGNYLQQKFYHNDQKASGSIKELYRLFSNLDSTNNPVWGFIANLVFVWDAKYVLQIENWKKTHQHKAITWLESIAELDALNSLAGFAKAQENYTYPTLSNKEHYIEATALGHPLIPNGGTTNDVHFEGNGKVYLITGSNMSGKSTFQRCVSTNLVFAQLGLPVAASSFSFSPMTLFTSMRTIDSIEENTSSFYAELKRLKQLINLSKEDKTVFYCIDEILKGTNSEDRHKGARAIAKQLSKLGASGFISTHDLYLSELSDEFNQQLVNYSFNSTIENEKIIFDYKLTEGACKSFNASQLMKNMGIEL